MIKPGTRGFVRQYGGDHVPVIAGARRPNGDIEATLLAPFLVDPGFQWPRGFVMHIDPVAEFIALKHDEFEAGDGLEG